MLTEIFLFNILFYCHDFSLYPNLRLEIGEHAVNIYRLIHA